MHWNDSAIILSVKKHGETSAIVRALAHQHGVYAGVVKGASSKANRGILQPGNCVNIIWQARLSEHIGSFKAELLHAHAAHIMQDAQKLIALTSACAMIELSLPERHPYPRLYTLFDAFLHDLITHDAWLPAYVFLELDLLAEAGFGLDLSCCAATGVTDNLLYVSPKSGRAVSREAGEPYKDKLLRLPAFLLPEGEKSGSGGPSDIANGLTLTGYFLEHWLLTPHKRKLPAARERLVQTLYKPAETL